jgi:hypothetical protein
MPSRVIPEHLFTEMNNARFPRNKNFLHEVGLAITATRPVLHAIPPL